MSLVSDIKVRRRDLTTVDLSQKVEKGILQLYQPALFVPHNEYGAKTEPNPTNSFLEATSAALSN